MVKLLFLLETILEPQKKKMDLNINTVITFFSSGRFWTSKILK